MYVFLNYLFSEQSKWNQKMFIFSVGSWINTSEKRPTPPNFQVFSFANMKEATQNFSEENKLGQGGFGPVYRVIYILDTRYLFPSKVQ